ncbi:aminotransferase class V-fold PLP-dependent enzyme [Maribacter antarcticus]|uniref:aminotransferase class V-fold PLP-dependent enzyme n=1 Tax=Maribacter antarcticus TaxID=505250 RepID=UPI00047C63E9|nr:aminotransferase class V-fold PLP-dependent enzyme [Maribacter antarcticus]
MKKRQFLRRLGQVALVTPFLPLSLNAQDDLSSLPYALDEEEFWLRIRKDYCLKPDYINLENGYYNFIPQPTMEKYIEHLKMVNYEASYYMRTDQWDNKARVRDRLAKLVGTTSEELIITRNTTESLDLIIGGYPWEKGDEAIFAKQDYGAMKDHFQLMSKKYGIINKVVSIPNHPESDEEIVSLYEAQITSRTKLMMVCHMVNITGQILPIRKLSNMAHTYGVEVLVDGAHCIGHFDVNLKELQCDYYGSSLHKWLSVPLGSGMLYVAKEKITKIWPLFADYNDATKEIQRLNHTGTIPVHTDLAIDDAIDYLELIGVNRKEKRLRYLQKYWSDQLREVKYINVNTPKEIERSCGIANVGIAHINPKDLAKNLLDEFKIFTVAIDYANVKGCRITPNVYTTKKELDVFVNAMKTLAQRV